MKINYYQIKCCHKCTTRTSDCHATCKTYADEKADIDAKNEAIKEAKAQERMVTDVQITGVKRTMTHRGNNNWHK